MKKYIDFITEKFLPKDFDQELTNKLKTTIDCAEKYRGSYYWHPASSSNNRRANEEKFKKNYEDYTFEYKGDKYEVNYEYRESAKNVYFKLSIYKNDIKTNLTVIKNIYNNFFKYINTLKRFHL